MNNRMSSAVLLLIVALVPVSASADIIEVSDVEITAFASFSSQRQPETTDFDAKTATPGSLTRVEAFVPALGGIPFPNAPITQTLAFASSAADANDFFGVGVSGFFFPSSLPPHALLASGTFVQTITNNLSDPVGMSVDFFVPAPTIQFIGQVGNSFPAGADPARDVSAEVSIRMLTTLTRPDGSSVDTIHLDYGMRTFREPVSGVLGALPSRDATNITRLEELGFFSFQLPDLERNDFSLGDIGPGDTLTFSYDYFVQASVGFGETGIFAAIGDPFNLSTGGGHFNIQVGDSSPPPSPVPEPTSMLLFGTGLTGVGAFLRKRRSKRTK